MTFGVCLENIRSPPLPSPPLPPCSDEDATENAANIIPDSCSRSRKSRSSGSNSDKSCPSPLTFCLKYASIIYAIINSLRYFCSNVYVWMQKNALPVHSYYVMNSSCVTISYKSLVRILKSDFRRRLSIPHWCERLARKMTRITRMQKGRRKRGRWVLKIKKYNNFFP